MGPGSNAALVAFTAFLKKARLSRSCDLTVRSAHSCPHCAVMLSPPAPDDDGALSPLAFAGALAHGPVLSPPPARRRSGLHGLNRRGHRCGSAGWGRSGDYSSGGDEDDSHGWRSERREPPPRASAIERRTGEVSLVVAGRRFVCERNLFTGHPDTMLGRMFGSVIFSATHAEP